MRKGGGSLGKWRELALPPCVTLSHSHPALLQFCAGFHFLAPEEKVSAEDG